MSLVTVSIQIQSGPHAGLQADFTINTPTFEILFSRRKYESTSEDKAVVSLPSDKEISSRHMIISYNSALASSWRAWDEGSTNGSYQVIRDDVHGAKQLQRLGRKEAAVCIPSGSEFAIGTTRFTVAWAETGGSKAGAASIEERSPPQMEEDAIILLTDEHAPQPARVPRSHVLSAVTPETGTNLPIAAVEEPAMPHLLSCTNCGVSLLRDDSTKFQLQLAGASEARKKDLLQRLLSLQRAVNEIICKLDPATTQAKPGIVPKKKAAAAAGRKPKAAPVAEQVAGSVTTEDAKGKLSTGTKRKRGDVAALQWAKEAGPKVDELFTVNPFENGPCTTLPPRSAAVSPIQARKSTTTLWDISTKFGEVPELTSSPAFRADDFSQSRYTTAMLHVDESHHTIARMAKPQTQPPSRSELPPSGSALGKPPLDLGTYQGDRSPRETRAADDIAMTSSPPFRPSAAPQSAHEDGYTTPGVLSDSLHEPPTPELAIKMRDFGMKPGAREYMLQQIALCQAAVVELLAAEANGRSDGENAGEGHEAASQEVPTNLEEIVVNYFRDNPELHDAALCLDPIDVTTLATELKSKGHRSNPQQLRPILARLGLSVELSWR